MNEWTRANKEAYEAERIANANRQREDNERHNRELRDRDRAEKVKQAREHDKFMREATQRVIRDIEKENQKNFYENLNKKDSSSSRNLTEYDQLSSIPNNFNVPTFLKTVKDAAFTGCIISLAYAFLVLNLNSIELLSLWALKGTILGVLVGIALYLVIILFQLALIILEVVLRIIFWVCIIAGGIYTFSFLIEFLTGKIN